MSIWTTQDRATCDICGQDYQAADSQTLILVHGANQAKQADSVCPACIERFGFTPIIEVPTKRYEQLIEREGIRNLLREASGDSDR